jgi:diacylglycerol kinase family enzyme
MAILALALLFGGTALAAYQLALRFPRPLIPVLGAVAGVALAWEGLIRIGPQRALFLVLAGVALAGAVTSIAIEVGGVADLAPLLLLAGAAGATRAAFATHVPLPRAEPPSRPVLFFNPRSGGGKAAKFNLAEEARKRGYETIGLGPGDDLAQLVEDAIARGADGLAVAGGDGSQAVVAAAAAEHGLPYGCIPAGTRNHFALDLGVDRDDVVGSLDAFVDGGERVVDLGEVNGRVFVNNVALGLYALAVQRPEYRDAKLKTLLDVIPATAGPEREGLDLRWRGPDGEGHGHAVTILVSNNRYRLGQPIVSNTRPRIDDGLLGIAVVQSPRGSGQPRRPRRPWSQWSAPEFEVAAADPVPAGIDGESAVLDPPLRFRVRPGVLHARIARDHPGASPSARMPASAIQTPAALLRIARGR